MLKELKRYVTSEKKDPDIFDIVVYGSAVKGKDRYNDIDLTIIFRRGTLKERLNRLQTIKKKIKSDKKIDIKTILLEELFKPEFFARSGIFLEGVSLFDGKPFAGKIDFEGAALFIYSLKDKTHTEKVKFNYLLSGRTTEGLIDLFKGKHLAPGVIEIPMESSSKFEEILKQNKIRFSKELILKKT